MKAKITVILTLAMGIGLFATSNTSPRDQLDAKQSLIADLCQGSGKSVCTLDELKVVKQYAVALAPNDKDQKQQSGKSVKLKAKYAVRDDGVLMDAKTNQPVVVELDNEKVTLKVNSNNQVVAQSSSGEIVIVEVGGEAVIFDVSVGEITTPTGTTVKITKVKVNAGAAVVDFTPTTDVTFEEVDVEIDADDDVIVDVEEVEVQVDSDSGNAPTFDASANDGAAAAADSANSIANDIAAVADPESQKGISEEGAKKEEEEEEEDPAGETPVTDDDDEDDDVVVPDPGPTGLCAQQDNCSDCFGLGNDCYWNHKTNKCSASKNCSSSNNSNCSKTSCS